MKRIFSTILFAAALAGLVACADIDGLRSDVDDLKSRVTALEKQVDIFNGNIETLQLLATSSTINTVTETAVGYELLMSNGRIITLKNGPTARGSHRSSPSMPRGIGWSITGTERVSDPFSATVKR